MEQSIQCFVGICKLVNNRHCLENKRIHSLLKERQRSKIRNWFYLPSVSNLFYVDTYFRLHDYMQISLFNLFCDFTTETKPIEYFSLTQNLEIWQEAMSYSTCIGKKSENRKYVQFNNNIIQVCTEPSMCESNSHLAGLVMMINE